MALSRELINRLESDEEPLQKRIKLAHNAFFAIDLPIVRKEDLIFQWLCKICTIEDDAWSSLQCCLKSEDINIKGNIKKLLIDVLISQLNKNSSNVCSKVLECYSLLFSNAVIQQYFSNKPQDLELLLKSLINYAHLSCGDRLLGINTNTINNADKSVTLVYNTIITVMENLIQIYKKSVNMRDEISTIFIHEVLYPLCSIIDYKHIDSTNRMGATMHKCIHQIIFVKNKHLQDEPHEIHKTTLSELFSELTNNAKTRDLQSNLAVFISIFRVTIGFFKSNNIMVDIIFRRLIKSAGKYKKEILISLFDYFGGTSFDFENKIDDVTLLQFFQDIVDDVLSVEKLASIDYKILTMTAYFNPILIETKIENIICKLYFQEPTVEHNNLLISILDASILLRQEHKLILQLLTTLRQVINSETKSNLMVQSFFPLEFRKKFTKSISSITNSQTLTILKTLIDHLHISCMDSLKSNTTCNSIIMMTAVTELLTAFFQGIYIFGNTSTFTHQQDFVNIFNGLGKDLSLLIKKALHFNHNTNVITVLLSVILSWCEIQNIMKYYLSKRINNEFTFPILDDEWQQLVKVITNLDDEECRNNMNKLIIHCIKYSTFNEPTIKFDALVGGLKYVWGHILTDNSDIISLLSDKDTSELVSLLVTDMMLHEDKFYQWIEVISKENIQENKRFLIYLLCHVLIQIETIPKKGITKSLIQHIDSKLVLTAELDGKKKVKKMLESMKEEILECKWKQMENDTFNLVKMYLNIILHVPLMYLKSDVKAMLLIIIFAISKECIVNDDIQNLCNKIFLKLFQTTELDILQYLDPMSIVCHLPQCKAFPKALKKSLRNITSYDILKTLINSSVTCKESMYILLQCIENVKPKLEIDQKAIFKQAERKLCKKMFSVLPTKIELPYDVKCLTLILKITILNNEIENILKQCAQTTLHEIFVTPQELDLLHSHELIEAGLQLSVIVFRNYKEFDISPQIIKQIWSVMLKYPCEDLLLPFIECTEVKAVHLLKEIHHQMIEELPKPDSSLLGNIFNIWNAILKPNMSAQRNKFRTEAIEHLCRNMEIVNISEQNWSKSLELLQNVLNCKHLYISHNIIDMSMNIALKALDEGTISVCNDVLILCGILIKDRMNIIVDRVPALLLLYRRVINVTVQLSKTCNNQFEEHKCKCLLLDIEKFTNCLVKQKKDMMRLSPYIIADLVKLLSEGGLLPFVKISLENTIATLINICDQHGIALLSRTLPEYVQAVFKTQLDTFNKFHKFSGKI